jgi:carbamoyl-phosphate synthase large subunit
VFPFAKFAWVDTILGPEMRSTGEVMGVADGFGAAFHKGLLAAGMRLPQSGRVFVSVRDADKALVLPVVRHLAALGFALVATRGTAAFIRDQGLQCELVNKVKEGRPHVVDALVNGGIAMVINTTVGAQAIADSFSIRRTSLMHRIPHFTTISAALAAAHAIEAARDGEKTLVAHALQDYHRTPGYSPETAPVNRAGYRGNCPGRLPLHPPRFTPPVHPPDPTVHPRTPTDPSVRPCPTSK